MSKKSFLQKIVKNVSSDYHEYPIVKYLKILQPNWTKVFAIKMIRTKNVLINKHRTSINYKLQEGDEIEIFGYREISNQKNLNISKLNPLNVVYEDDYLIIVDKEPKIAVQEDEKHLFNNMKNRLLNHLGHKISEDSWTPSFVHRLDYNTTGLLIGAKKYTAYKNMTEIMKQNKVEKYYKAIVNGLIPFKQRVIKCYLLKEDNKVKVVPKGTKNAKESITEVFLIKHIFSENSSLVDLKLITGKTHQIRAHLSHIGFPIRGDQKYGVEKDKKNYPYPALTAYKLKFSEDIKSKSLLGIRGKEFEKKDIWFENLKN